MSAELAGLGRFAGPATLILSSLAQGPKHGYGITKDVEEFAGVRLQPGTLYGALSRLEHDGLIEALAGDGRRRPYGITPARCAGIGGATDCAASGDRRRPSAVIDGADDVMTWVRATPRFVGQMAERHLLLFVLASIVFWTLLSPLALGWLVLWLIDRYRALDKSPAAKRERRVTRLLRWYPAEWRARYGDEMAALLHDMIIEGRGGPRLGLNVVKEGLAAAAAPPARRRVRLARGLLGAVRDPAASRRDSCRRS